MSDTPYGKIIKSLAALATLQYDDNNRINRSYVMDEVVRIRANSDLLERENAALRHDIERHVKIASEQATELADLRAQLEAERDKYLNLSEAYEGCDVELKEVARDVIALCLRLCMEPNDSHSPDTADVLNRWRKVWEAVAGGMPIDAAMLQEGN